MDRFDPAREISDTFIDRGLAWLRESGELLVLLRYLRAAGSKDVALCRTPEEFRRVLDGAPIGAEIVLARGRWLPLREVVTDAFIERVVAEVPDRGEHLAVSIRRFRETSLCDWMSMGDRHEHLRETLEGRLGEEVAVGVSPGFLAGDGDELISAAKGGIDGPR